MMALLVSSGAVADTRACNSLQSPTILRHQGPIVNVTVGTPTDSGNPNRQWEPQQTVGTPTDSGNPNRQWEPQKTVGTPTDSGNPNRQWEPQQTVGTPTDS